MSGTHFSRDLVVRDLIVAYRSQHHRQRIIVVIFLFF